MAKRKAWDNYWFATAMPHGIYKTEEEGCLEIPAVLFFCNVQEMPRWVLTMVYDT